MLINYFVVAVKLSKIYLGLTQSILYEWSCGIHVTEKNHLDEQINVIRSNIVFFLYGCTVCIDPLRIIEDLIYNLIKIMHFGNMIC